MFLVVLEMLSFILMGSLKASQIANYFLPNCLGRVRIFAGLIFTKEWMLVLGVLIKIGLFPFFLLVREYL
jgi:hypothetical protein